MEKDPSGLYYASDRLQNNIEFLKKLKLLEILPSWDKKFKQWFSERMEVLNNLESKNLSL